MKKLLLILFCCLTLSGCVATAVIAGTTAAGVLLADKRSVKTMHQDHVATRNTQTLIDHSKKLKGRSHISVATFHHVMLMVGQAQTPELRDYAYQLVSKHAKNIQRIYNKVTIAGAPSFIQRSNDAWLTTKVKTALFTTKRLRSNQIKIVTESSTVYLMGLVNHQQGEKAGNIARRVPGVKKVVKVFQYI